MKGSLKPYHPSMSALPILITFWYGIVFYTYFININWNHIHNLSCLKIVAILFRKTFVCTIIVIKEKTDIELGTCFFFI